MSVRVVARIRPLLSSENDKDIIVRRHDGPSDDSGVVKIPNPKNFAEEYSFQFNSVYGQEATQQEIYDAEVAPTVKHLFQGYDVTLFAYGSTGTGKTFTMRGAKSLADRGMIPRLLSSIYRKSRALEKSGVGNTSVAVTMSYYEIYNDKVYDLFVEPPSGDRNATGLPIREAEGGKTVVVGLTEQVCGSLKEFEALYDAANKNRSTGATKLNAHSSRSHAILCVKVTVSNTTTGEMRVSTASAIDLAGSEDNRRTGNGKDRMVESASINKSLFVLAQCVEAIGKNAPRIPYRESKMTRILSLGQNNGFTVMILNLAPVKSFHLDTLSSLNLANRTKKIEVREVENEPIFKGPPRLAAGFVGVGPTMMQRQPLRPLMNGANLNLVAQREAAAAKGGEKPMKAFSVYSDKNKAAGASILQPRPSTTLRSPQKRIADASFMSSTRPSKNMRPTPTFIRRGPPETATLTKQTIESLVEAKVSEILAARNAAAAEAPEKKGPSDEVQRRLDSIEQRLAGQEGERAEGLSYLLMAKQHQSRGEERSALRMYRLAVPFFPENERLRRKIAGLEDRDRGRGANGGVSEDEAGFRRERSEKRREAPEADEDESYHDDQSYAVEDNEDDDSFHAPTAQPKRKRAPTAAKLRTPSPDPLSTTQIEDEPPTPRTQALLRIVNSRDVRQLTRLNGLGVKRAEGLVRSLEEMDGEERYEVGSWAELGSLRGAGIGGRVLEGMRAGLAV